MSFFHGVTSREVRPTRVFSCLRGYNEGSLFVPDSLNQLPSETTMTSLNSKRCHVCRTVKPLDDFHQDRTRVDGRQ